MPDIKPDLSIQELLKKYPDTKKVLKKHGMMCTGCGGFESEKIRHAAQNHGVPVDKLIQELKEATKSGK